jgi:hypothetical protein
MDIGPGDLVRCVRGGQSRWGTGAYLVEGRVYRVRRIGVGALVDGRRVPLIFVDAPEASIASRAGRDHGWGFSRFRKLPDISEWLETSTTYEEPKRVPAPREVEGV